MKLEFLQANRTNPGEVSAFFAVRCEPGKWDTFSAEAQKCFAASGEIDQVRFQRAFLEFLGAADAMKRPNGAIVELVTDRDFKDLFQKGTR